jgi:hypothetical protein
MHFKATMSSCSRTSAALLLGRQHGPTDVFFFFFLISNQSYAMPTAAGQSRLWLPTLAKLERETSNSESPPQVSLHRRASLNIIGSG